jgi:hypothetical protein
MTFLKREKLYCNQSGQILLVVVLTMVIALTVGLSIASRIVTELKLSKQNEESQRAFQAAEAGIQQTLKQQSALSTPVDLKNNSSFTTTFTIDNGSAIVLNNGQDVDQAAGADVWLSNYPDYSSPMGSGATVNATVYWGSPSQSSCLSGSGDLAVPALEVVLLQGSVSSPSIQKYIFEGSGCSRIAGATTGTPGTFTVKGTQFSNSATLSFANGLIMKVIPVFNSSLVSFQSGNFIFPAQGSIVTSTGNSGDTVRKVVYYKSYPQMPLEVFPYSLLSQ